MQPVGQQRGLVPGRSPAGAGAVEGYGADRNKPEADAASHLSPYLHFGQISPVEIALAVREAGIGDDDDHSAYLEELIVRRELALPEDEVLVCGIAIGKADPNAPANRLVPEREPVEGFTSWLD